MPKIPFTSKQQASVREFAAAIGQLQQRQSDYLKAVLDAADVPEKSNWSIAPDASGLVLVEPNPVETAEAA